MNMTRTQNLLGGSAVNERRQTISVSGRAHRRLSALVEESRRRGNIVTLAQVTDMVLLDALDALDELARRQQAEMQARIVETVQTEEAETHAQTE